MIPDSLHDRRSQSDSRFADLEQSLQTLGNSAYDLSQVAIYATGSYGRSEASPSSDIDLFMVDLADPDDRISNIDQLLLKADLIRICRDLGFPEFSGDGRFLVVHPLAEIQANLGSAQDDAANYFTARLLLLLESRCLFNPSAYADAVDTVIGEYFRDYEEHAADFLPGFLVNDIVRFWKTLCLNYEYDRSLNRANRAADDSVRYAFRLKNLKLVFSRLMTCYSALAPIAVLHRCGGIHPDNVKALVERVPTARLEYSVTFDERLSQAVAEVLGQYTWFLETLATAKEDALSWLSSDQNWQLAKDQMASYSSAYFRYLRLAASDGAVGQYIMM